jgi:hypothetical protein
MDDARLNRVIVVCCMASEEARERIFWFIISDLIDPAWAKYEERQPVGRRIGIYQEHAMVASP